MTSTLELILNKSYYENSDFIGDIRIVISDFDKLLHDAIIMNSFSEMADIYVLSAALNKPIMSYYPPQTHSEFSLEPYTRRIGGNEFTGGAPQITIMWSIIHEPQ